MLTVFGVEIPDEKAQVYRVIAEIAGRIEQELEVQWISICRLQERCKRLEPLAEAEHLRVEAQKLLAARVGLVACLRARRAQLPREVAQLAVEVPRSRAGNRDAWRRPEALPALADLGARLTWLAGYIGPLSPRQLLDIAEYGRTLATTVLRIASLYELPPRWLAFGEEVAGDNLAEFGGRLRQRRLTLGVGQRGLSLASSVSSGMLSMLENSQTNPSLDVCSALAGALQVSPGWLAFGDGGTPQRP